MTQRLRSHDLDWLRLLAIMLLIPFPSAAVFYDGELGSFYVVNAERSVGLSLFIRTQGSGQLGANIATAEPLTAS
jgi:hypothetical protein